MRLPLACALLAACGSSSTPTPTVCQKTDRRGTYELVWTATSGDCPTPASGLVSADEPAPPGTTCSVASDVWSEGDCKDDRAWSCTVNGSTVDYVAVTRQETQDGARLDGAITVTLTGAAGTCRGSFAVSYTRQ